MRIKITNVNEEIAEKVANENEIEFVEIVKLNGDIETIFGKNLLEFYIDNETIFIKYIDSKGEVKTILTYGLPYVVSFR